MIGINSMSLRVDRDTRTVGTLRRLLRMVVLDGELAACSDASLVLTELVTNAFRHTQGAVEIVMTPQPDGLLLQITDDEPGALVEPPAADATAEGGRGIGIVAALTSGWGVRPCVDGKTVWALVPCAAPGN